MPILFEPFTLKGVSLRNRIVAAPMCQYSATDGLMNDWHHAHLTQIARGGSGLVIVEATAVSPEGRVSFSDVGLWNDRQGEAMIPTVRAIRKAGAVPGIQLGHAGRKASVNRPWQGDDHIADDAPNGWPILAPSPIAHGGPNLWKQPREMTPADIRKVQDDFVSAARRALDLGFEWLELHFAHGYLGQSFLSPHSNRRQDEYGGSFDNRARFLSETLAAVRAIWPEGRPLAVRLGVVEFDGRNDERLEESIELARAFKQDGLDLLCASLGFSTPDAKIPWGPAFLAPIAGRVRRESGLPISLAWGLGVPEIAERVLRDGQADLVKVGRALLADPHWPYAAAVALGVERASWATLPPPYAHWLERHKP